MTPTAPFLLPLLTFRCNPLLHENTLEATPHLRFFLLLSCKPSFERFEWYKQRGSQSVNESEGRPDTKQAHAHG
jgi:hypothetical protein